MEQPEIAVKKRRQRRKTFAKRLMVSYRFQEELHETMTTFCADNHTSMNTWLVGLVKNKLIAAGYFKVIKPNINVPVQILDGAPPSK